MKNPKPRHPCFAFLLLSPSLFFVSCSNVTAPIQQFTSQNSHERMVKQIGQYPELQELLPEDFERIWVATSSDNIAADPNAKESALSRRAKLLAESYLTNFAPNTGVFKSASIAELEQLGDKVQYRLSAKIESIDLYSKGTQVNVADKNWNQRQNTFHSNFKEVGCHITLVLKKLDDGVWATIGSDSENYKYTGGASVSLIEDLNKLGQDSPGQEGQGIKMGSEEISELDKVGVIKVAVDRSFRDLLKIAVPEIVRSQATKRKEL